MLLLRKLFIFLLISGMCLAIGSQSSSAEPPTTSSERGYKTDLKVIYKVDRDGKTIITQDYKITNLDPTIYINKYGFQTTVANIYNVKVNNNGKELLPQVVSDGNGSTITFEFPEEIVGQNKERTFSVTYETRDLATVAGNILELRLPKLNQPELYDSVITELRIPSYFGEPSRINVQANTVTADMTENVFTFTNIFNQITAIFGNSQTFAVTLRYNLENTTAGNAITQIALPPDTSWQKVHYTQLDPPPQSIKMDDDGNWIATYALTAKAKLTVNALAQVLVSLQPDPTVPVKYPLDAHTQSDEFWETQDSQIQDLAAEHSTAKSINQYVVDTLTYNNFRTGGAVARLGALGALNSPTDAICQEFTDLFVTVARAAGIPSRRATGYAFAENRSLRPLSLEGDVLHSWPEYFDYSQNVWQPIDPTWQNTTKGTDYFSQFDVNHIVFSLNGLSSTKPYPAGSYKTITEATAQDVVVTPVDSFPIVAPDIQINLTPITFFTIPIPGFYTLTYENFTGQAWYDMPIRLQDGNSHTSFDSFTEQTIQLLPFERRQKTIIIRNPMRMSSSVILQLNYDQQTIINNQYQVSTLPLPFPISNLPFTVTAVAGVLICSLIIAGCLLVFRRRK